MKRFFLYGSFMLATLTIPMAAHAQSASPVDTVNQAVGAIGGADALRAVKGLTFKADAQFWEPQQSYIADGEPRFIGNSKITFTWKNDDDQRGRIGSANSNIRSSKRRNTAKSLHRNTAPYPQEAAMFRCRISGSPHIDASSKGLFLTSC